MKQITYILILILFAACGQNNRNPKEKGTNLQLDTLAEEGIDFSIDTLNVNNYLLIFENADSFKRTDIYGDLDYRIKLTDTVGNFFDKAEKIQTYLINQFEDYFHLTDSTLVLKLANGNTMNFDRYIEERDWDNSEFVGYIFEHYFDKIDYYLLKVQYYEGNAWILVNRKNGFTKHIGGLPYISKDNKKIITINSDLYAGYSFNGIELLSILADSLHLEFSVETEKWGPLDVKWINENEFLLKRELFNVNSTITDYKYDYKRVRVENKTYTTHTAF